MRRAILCGWLVALLLAGCSWLPRAGPTGREVAAQAATGDKVSFDLVKVDDAVIKVLRAQGEPGFPERFKKYIPPPAFKIAVGDTVSVIIWEAAANGLFGESLAEWSVPSGVASQLFGTATTGAGTLLGTGESVTAFSSDTVLRLLGLQVPGDQTGISAAPGGAQDAPTGGAAQGLAPSEAAQGLAALAGRGLGGAPTLTQDRPQTAPLGAAPGAAPSTLPLNALTTPTMTSRNVEELLQQAASAGRPGTRVPDQQVGSDGAISIPYAGRIAAAGRTPAEVERTIEQRLGPKALEPHALVVIRRSIANSVAVAGDAVKGGRVPLSPGGDRLLQVIAAAGGANAPPHQTFVELSRGGITATVPLAILVDHPDQDIFAEPGDVLTVIRRPQTFSAFGASGKNTAITFDNEKLSLAEALAKAGGLLDDRADPQAVFLLRYEPVGVVKALGQPIATAAPAGVSPVVYRLDLRDAKSYPLAQEFPVRDKDIIFVANAELAGVYKGFETLSNLTGPIFTGLLTCQSTKC
jgi:polysaccharide export outer membrane protein